MANEIRRKNVEVPWDLKHLLQTYDIKDLSEYASKMLITTEGAYLGTQMLNNE